MNIVTAILFIVIYLAILVIVFGGAFLIIKKAIEAFVGWIKRIPAEPVRKEES
jgi:cytochrome c biogenesis protein CcdA